jgi:circadian clock protein KaiC
MLEGGVYRGSTVLISGTAGTGKTSLSAHFAKTSAEAGERCLYLAFEESPSQIMRNMRSIGIDLRGAERKGLLKFVASRPVLTGLEGHLAMIHKLVRDFDPKMVILDPISDLTAVSSARDAKAMMMRLVDFLKTKQITAILVNLHRGAHGAEETDMGISSLIDTWIYLRDLETGGERNRGLYILKSRGTAHSNQIREFLLTRRGIKLRPAYIGAEGVLTGSARLTQESRDLASALVRAQETERQRRVLEGRRKTIEAQIEALRSELHLATEEERIISGQETDRLNMIASDREAMARSRRVSTGSFNGKDGKKKKRGE